MKYFTFLLLVIGFTTSHARTIDDSLALDALVFEIYDVISGPAGDRDWVRFNKIFHKDARMGAVVLDSLGHSKFYSFNPDQYRKMNEPVFKSKDFYEDELSRKVSKKNNLAWIESEYQFRFSKDGPIIQKGVNYIQAICENNTWKVISLIWQTN